MSKEISKITACLLWEVGAIKVSDVEPFRLTSGNMSPVYIDCRKLISYPVARDLVTSFAFWTYDKEKLQADYVAGGETAGIPYASWLAAKLNRPFVYVRKEPKGHGTGAQIEGDLIPGSMVLLYEDLITDGRSKLSFVEGIRRAECTVKDCLVVFDRLQGGTEELAVQGVRLYALTDMQVTLCAGVEEGYATKEDFESIAQYLEDPKLWHVRRGFEFRD